tara:strand:+ start:599 stop:1939 length:1341 start_codon:yes stop_codon:yes gene_type:complete
MKLLVCSFLIISFVFSYQSKENGLAAVVGDEVILISDLNKSMTDLGKNFFGVDFSVSQLSQQEYNSFKKDVLDLLIGNKLILLSAEEDTLISIGYDQINSFLDENIQNLIDFEFNGSVSAFESSFNTSVTDYKSKQWDEAREILFVEEKKRSILQSVSVTKEEVERSFNFYKKENPNTPDSFSFTLYETPVKPDSADFDKKKEFLFNIKENIFAEKITFEEALKKHSKRTPVSDALNGWWLRGDFSSIFPKNPALEKKLFGLSVGEVLNPVTTRLGFHLFLLEDRAGEKIKIKQIFIPLQEISIDLTPTIKEHESLLLSCDNDPGLFDSLAVANKNFYISSGIENYSGVFNSISFDTNMLKENPFYKELEKKLKTIKDESFSKPFVYKNSVFSLYKYLYEKEKEITFEDLYLKWDYFESLALQTKRNVYIEEWINTKKRDFYVKIY